MSELQRPGLRLGAVKATLLEELMMLDPAMLRTQLRNVNIEYSALLKSDVSNRVMRMAQLRAHRQRLMALLDGETLLDPVSDWPVLPVPHHRSA